ncbi:MAG: sigma-54 dependent transcriptional regulator [Opitutae bacterium]|nr:sigma-54 dependent transcriptional regulator [Opitutae bacterium]
MQASILIVDDEKNTREGLRLALEDDYDVYTASNAVEAFNLMELESFDVILTDLRMAGKSGMMVIDHAMAQSNKPICIMMTAYGDVDTAVEAMRRGAFDFHTKPINIEKLEFMIKRAIQSKSMEKENAVLHKRLDNRYQFSQIVGNSQAMVEVLDRVKLVAPTKATVLIEGQTGTGKELIAQSIHQNSERARKPFVAVHCAALAANLLESELFGHEKGSFTGANERRIGRFESSDGGTLFLDEIGEIDASTQVKLLRFLETRSFERLGNSKSIKVNIRLVCATNRNLSEMVQRGEFREDLYYRLNVIRIHLPSLIERKEDIPLLLKHYLRLFSKENEIPSLKLSKDTLNILANYTWPGNIRELRNFCENVLILKQGQTVIPEDLEAKFFNSETNETDDQSQSQFYNSNKSLNTSLSLDMNEKQLLRNALLKSGGNRTKAAQLMGISRRTLHRKLLKWPELDPDFS